MNPYVQAFWYGQHLVSMAGARRELTSVERRLSEILKALSEGYRSESWKVELASLDSRKAELTAMLAEPPLPALHPQVAEVFRQKAATLAEGLEYEDKREKARLELRGFVDRIVIPQDGLLEVFGNLGTMLAAAQGQRVGTDPVGKIGCGGGYVPLATCRCKVAA